MQPELSSQNHEERRQRFVFQLKENGCLKQGEYKLKSGLVSPYYIDLREITMFPQMFDDAVELIKNVINSNCQSQSQQVAIVGVPYGVVPVAAAVAYSCKLAYHPVRKETKSYGHKPDTDKFKDFKMILIEDVMSTGSSIVETLKKLDSKSVIDIVVILDRNLGGNELLKREYPDIRIHSILKAEQLF